MSWIAVDKDGEEYVYTEKPIRFVGRGWVDMSSSCLHLTKGSAEKLTGKSMTWDDKPRKLV